MVDNNDLIVKLLNIGAIKFGEFKLQRGMVAPVYFDLGVITYHRDILASVSNLIWKKIEHQREEFAVICSVPYTGMDFATCICKENNVPMVLRRKEAKDRGTKKMIEGYYESGSNCLIVDVDTSESRVLDTAVELRKAGLQVTDAVVLLNMEQGGKQMMEQENITLHSILSISEVLGCLVKKEKITEKMALEVRHFIDSNNTFKAKESVVTMIENKEKVYHIAGAQNQRRVRRMFQEKAKLCQKQSNLYLSADGLIVKLFDIGGIKFGEFKLKSGLKSPVYFDFRVIFFYPDIFASVSNLIWKKIEHQWEQFAAICGVPLTASPIATYIYTDNNVHIVTRRKKAEDSDGFGTKKLIERYCEDGSNCLIMEDVVTSGSSILETAVELKKEGLRVTDAVAILDREQGGKQMLEQENITLHSILTISRVLDCLAKKEKITEKMALKVRHFIDSNNTFIPKETV